MSFPSPRTAILLLCCSGLLSGCAADFAVPDAAPVAQSTGSMGKIQGNNYGGHAPLVGAHIFLLEGYTNGYGGASKSLLKSGETATDFYGSTYPTIQDTTGTASTNPTYGDYYVVTDSRGDFDLSNGYTCDPGYPVYVYGFGGNPQTIPAVSITGATIAGTGPYTITFTTSATNLLYQGEVVNLSGFSGNFGTYINGTAQVVIGDANLTTTTFDVSVGSLTHNGVTLTTGAQAGIGTGTATQNTPIVSNGAVVNLAVLGICPNSGTANFTYLPFVYMNEVSTAAAAYALGGFFPAPGTAGLINAGAAAANLSIPASDSLALLGLQNAALTADQLYDIGGSNSSCAFGTGCDGETHIARPTTPGVAVYATTTLGSPTVSVGTSAGLLVGVTITGAGIPANTTITAINTGVTPNTLTLSANATATGANVPLRAGAGNGTVPQAVINAIGNILANCVDSNNTYNPYTATGTTSSQCTNLFGYTRSAGTSGTTPIDTASAAIDIAHNPWANVNNLVGLPTGNEPFQPTLATANDLSVGISYTPAHVGAPQGIAVDGSGRVWYTNFSTGYLSTLSPVGGLIYNIQHNGDYLGYVAIDTSGAAWYGDISNSEVDKVSAAGVFINAYDVGGLGQPYGIASDSIGHIYVENINADSVDEFTNAGVLTGAPANPLAGASTCGANAWHADHIATDNANNGSNMWYTSELGDFVCEVNSTTGALIKEPAVNAAQGAGTYRPEFIGIDVNGTAWFPDQNHAGMNKVTAGAAGVLTNPTGGTLSGAFGTAVDGAGNIFVSNRTSASITEYLGASSTAVSTTNFEGGGNASVMIDPLNLAIDPSGNLWVADYTGSRIEELVGLAAPTYTPLSVAASVNKLGSKP